MDFTPISSLKLKEAFSDLKKFQDVTCELDFLKEMFEWAVRGTIFIHDDADVGHSVFVTDTGGLGADKTFRITNPAHKDLFLWHIDGVIYKKNSKCDCAVLSKGYIGFIEFKANAENNTEEAARDNYMKAKSQLVLTIKDVENRCRNVGVNIREVAEVEAYAVFNRTVPNHHASQKNIAAQFSLETEGLTLMFQNEKNII